MSSNDHFGPGVTVPDEPNNLPAPLPDTNSIASTGNKTLSEVQKSNIAKYEESVKYGFTPVAGPMVCRDDKCPYFDKCPLVRNKIERPMGEDCPVEAFQIKQRVNLLILNSEIPAVKSIQKEMQQPGQKYLKKPIRIKIVSLNGIV